MAGENQTTRPRCPKCRIGGFKRCAWQVDRPRFLCTRCDHEWTSGKDGGEYEAWERREAERKENVA